MKETEVSTYLRHVSASKVESTQQFSSQRILERHFGNSKDVGGNVLLPFVDDHSSLGATSIESSLSEEGSSNDLARGTTPLQTTMTDIMERIPGE